MWSYETEAIRAWATDAVARVRLTAKDERGEIAQTVIIVAILAAAAIAIATIIAAKFRDKASTIPTE
jgi:hypothetical protein